jgi:8-hydroxy-5-deazaflavin:NADPH oxidoreductase
MRVAVIGAGNVGGTLGRRWAAAGHDVTFGVRDAARGADAVKGEGALPERAHVSSLADAVRDADVVVLATPWAAVAGALRELGAATGELDGVPLIDATNPLGPGFRVLVGPAGESGAEQVQALAPGARVVKAFNTTGYENMRDPVFDGSATVMFYAGDDTNAKSVARELIEVLGFQAIDTGGLVRARELEHLAVLWIAIAAGIGTSPLGRNVAFRLLRRG